MGDYKKMLENESENITKTNMMDKINRFCDKHGLKIILITYLSMFAYYGFSSVIK